MEAATLDRSGFSAYLQAVRELVRSRSRVFWLVAGLTALAALLRFATLGLQAYHHDEVVTASRILRGSFWHAMSAVEFSESAPPLYYAIAWFWTQVTGTGEAGLRSLSALAGVATVPVAYLLGRQLRDQRAGIAAAALVAVNPMLLWYSQEARSYALLVLLGGISLLYFLRAVDGGGRRDFVLWGLASGLALATHYFAIFPIAAEALWLLWRRRRASWRGLAVLGLFAVLLAPLAYRQMSYGHAEWISTFSLGHRLWETFAAFAVGETSDVIAQPEQPLLAIVPLALMLAALALPLWRGEREERRAAALPVAIAGFALGVPLLLAVLPGGRDFVIGRNLIPALLPLLAGVAVALTVRRARRAGLAIGIALVAYSFAFSVWASVSPALQRPDWEAVAARLGEPEEPRAMVSWVLGSASLRYYLSTGSFQAFPVEEHEWLVGEIDFISDGEAPPPPERLVGTEFVQTGLIDTGRLRIRRYEVPGPGLAPLRLKRMRETDLNFRTNGILLDGIGPG